MNEFELEQDHTRLEVAAYLRKLADGVEQDNNPTSIAGAESATITPQENIHFKGETNADSSWIGGDDGRSSVLELGWEADEELTIDDQPDPPHRVRGRKRA